MELLHTLGLNWKLFIAQIINFVLIMGVLLYFVYKPVLRLIDDRRERIKKSMEDAKELEKKVKEMEQERFAKLKELDVEAQQFLAKAKSQAEATKKEILDSAEKQVQDVLEKGRKQLEDDRRKMIGDIQETVTNVSVQLAEKILEREFSEHDQKKVMADLQKDLPSLLK